jgi:hypothetical protein
MPRPYTDIQAAISGNAVKNGSLIVSTTFTGQRSVNNLYTKNSPTINSISTKYGNKFYNGIAVQIVPASGI